MSKVRQHKSEIDKERIISIIIIIVSLMLFFAAAVYLVIYGGSFGKEAVKMEVMPNITGYKLDDVKGCYSRFFSLDVTGEQYSDYEKGTILSQSVSENEKYVSGKTIVQVTVSAGSKTAETTAAVTEETAETAEETEKAASLSAEQPDMDFESASTTVQRAVLTYGIDEQNSEIKAKLDEIYSVINPKGADGGYIYVDLTTGASAEFNADERFAAGNILRAPVIRSFVGCDSFDANEKISIDEIDGNMINADDPLTDGAGDNKNFTEEELVKAALEKNSRNAFNLLYDKFGFDNFNKLSADRKTGIELTDNDDNFRISSRKTAAYFKDLYFFMENNVNGDMMKNYMSGAEHFDLISDELSDYTVCERYSYIPQNNFYYYTLGSADIVYADNPYLIVVCIRGTGNVPAKDIFHKTASLTDELNSLLHK